MSDLDLNAPEVQDAIKKAVEDATIGLKNKNLKEMKQELEQISQGLIKGHSNLLEKRQRCY